jgi:hypothetical protein
VTSGRDNSTGLRRDHLACKTQFAGMGEKVTSKASVGQDQGSILCSIATNHRVRGLNSLGLKKLAAAVLDNSESVG